MFLVLVSSIAFATTWQQPPQEVLDVLHAAQNPYTWMSPAGEHAVLMRQVKYPPLSDRAAAMLPLAGIRIDARTNGYHGRNGYEDPVLLDIESGDQVPLDVGGKRVLSLSWSAPVCSRCFLWSESGLAPV